MRVTDQAAVEVVEMVLSGSINKQIVTAINAAGGRAVGLSGKDGNLVMAREAGRDQGPIRQRRDVMVDLGFVGEPDRGQSRSAAHHLEVRDHPRDRAHRRRVPRARPTTSMPTRWRAPWPAPSRRERLILLTDVEGVLDQDKKLIPRLTAGEARDLIADGTISGGMIPKIQTAIDAVEGGVHAAVILDGRIPHVLSARTFHRAWRRNVDHRRMMRRAGCGFWGVGADLRSPRLPGRAQALQSHQLYSLCRHLSRW